MSNLPVIKAVFIKKDTMLGRGEVLDFYAYWFETIPDNKKEKARKVWFKETQLLKKISFHKKTVYEITLSSADYAKLDGNRLPYPVEIKWKGGDVQIKGGNGVVVKLKGGKENNYSTPLRNIASMAKRQNYLVLREQLIEHLKKEKK